jgi:hypothetical protein
VLFHRSQLRCAYNVIMGGMDRLLAAIFLLVTIITFAGAFPVAAYLKTTRAPESSATR